MLAGVIRKFYFIHFGLGFVLASVGLKMVWLNDLYDGKFPITWSLGIIAVAVAASVVLSIVIPSKDVETTDQAA
jgi:tellurite resistance protein TerC